MKRTLPLTICIGLASLAVPTWAADLDASIKLPAGARLAVTVRTEGSSIDGRGNSFNTTITRNFEEAITPSPAGYRVEQTAQGVTYDPPPSPTVAALTAALSTSGDDAFVYQTDTSLKPTLILEMNGGTLPSRIVRNSDGTTTTVGGSPAQSLTNQPVVQMAARLDWRRLMSPVAGAQLNLDQPLASAFSATADQSPDPDLIGIPMQTSIELKSLNVRAGTAIVLISTTYDPAAVSKALAAYVQKHQANPIYARGLAPKEDIGQLKLDYSQICTDTIDIPTGVITSMTCLEHQQYPSPNLYQMTFDTRTTVSAKLTKL